MSTRAVHVCEGHQVRLHKVGTDIFIYTTGNSNVWKQWFELNRRQIFGIDHTRADIEMVLFGDKDQKGDKIS